MQAILEGNNDNPERAPTRHSHTENLSGNRFRYLPKIASREEGGLGQKTTITTAYKSNMSKMIDSCESAVRPC